MPNTAPGVTDSAGGTATPLVNGSCSKGNSVFSAFSALSVRGRGAARLAAVTFVSGLLAAGATVAVADTASADEAAQNQRGATATIGGLKTYGEAGIHAIVIGLLVSAGVVGIFLVGGGSLPTDIVLLHNPTK